MEDMHFGTFLFTKDNFKYTYSTYIWLGTSGKSWSGTCN